MPSLYLILPCYELDDFSLTGPDGEGEQIMSAWLAAFNPQVLLLADKLPQWIAGYTPAENPKNSLIVMPDFVYGADYTWLDDRRVDGCEVVEFGKQSVDELIEIFKQNLIALKEKESENSEPIPNDSETESNSNPEKAAELMSESETVADSELKSESETDSAVELKTDSQTDSQIDSQTDSELKSEVESNSNCLNPISDLQKSNLTFQFYSLAFSFFLSEMVTRRLRYTSFMDSDNLFTHFKSAAESIQIGNIAQMTAELQACADIILQSKEYYFPTENYLLDFAVVSSIREFENLSKLIEQIDAANSVNTTDTAKAADAENTANTENSMDAGLSTEIEDSPNRSSIPVGLFMSGRMLEKYSQQFPESFAVLLKLLQQNNLTLISGEYIESPLPMMPLEGILDRLYDALYKYKQLTGLNMKLFGRLSNGLTPLLPGLLKRLHLDGVLYCTFDTLEIPMREKSKFNWTGLDGNSIPALSAKPMDLESSQEMFRLPEILAKNGDTDYSLAATFVQQPKPLSDLDNKMGKLLLNSNQFGSILGNFSSISTYFNNTAYSGEEADFSPDEYSYNFLTRQMEKGWINPLSRWSRYYSTAGQIVSVSKLESIAAVIAGYNPKDSIIEQWEVINQSVVKKDDFQQAVSDFQQELSTRVKAAAQAIAGRLFDKSDRKNAGIADSDLPTGLVAVNPSSQTVKQLIDVSELGSIPEINSVVKQVYPMSKKALVEIPALGCGFVGGKGRAWQDGSDSSERIQKTVYPAEQTGSNSIPKIANNLFELSFDRATGMLYNVYDYHTRRNYLAQILAVRLGSARIEQEEDDAADYSISIADSMEKEVSDSSQKMIVTGRLVDRQMNILYRYIQTTTINIDSQKIEFDIQIDPENSSSNSTQPGGFLNTNRRYSQPYNYFACRWAWGDDLADTYISVGGARYNTQQKELISPEFIELKSENHSLVILPGGLPRHNRIGSHRLDTLLSVSGESATRFHLEAIIQDGSIPAPILAQAYFEPLVLIPVYNNAVPRQEQAGAIDLNAPNVKITSCYRESVSDNPDVKHRLIIRLEELLGRMTTVQIELYKRAVSAQINDFCGQMERKIDIDAGRPTFTLQPYSWQEIQIEL